MIGWTPAGEEVELTDYMQRLVELLLDVPEDSALKTAVCYHSRSNHGSTVLTTAARYMDARAAGKPLEGDPSAI